MVIHKVSHVRHGARKFKRLGSWRTLTGFCEKLRFIHFAQRTSVKSNKS